MRNTSISVTLRNEYVLERIKDIKADHPFWGTRIRTLIFGSRDRRTAIILCPSRASSIYNNTYSVKLFARRKVLDTL